MIRMLGLTEKNPKLNTLLFRFAKFKILIVNFSLCDCVRISLWFWGLIEASLVGWMISLDW